ncbi:MAG: hypothetical protein AAFP86_07690, partial [Planctomycetota bacterium]
MIRIVIVPNPLDPEGATDTQREPGVTLLELLPDWVEDGTAAVWMNDRRIPADEWDALIPGDESIVAVGGKVEGFEISLGQILLTAVVSTAASFVVSALFPPPKASLARDDDESPAYSFRGQSNQRTEGTPIELIYGEFRAPGTVIATAVDTGNGTLDTFLRVLVSYGRGPIRSIGDVATNSTSDVALVGDALPRGLTIAGNAAENYDDVEAFVKLGLDTQKALTGFDEVQQLGLRRRDLDPDGVELPDLVE